ncbi:MAG: DNA adenine methylase [Promethearchaeota archaeon]
MNSTLIKRKKKLIAFGWYGGKFNHLDWLLPLLPETHHYCEPFGGSASVLLNRKSSKVETYNDIDGEVVNFFRVLRDKKEELLYAIGMTPFSRREFQIAIESNGNSKDLSDIERARRFFVRARQVRTGLAQTASNGRWANCLSTSRAGMAGAVSRWLGSVEGLEYIASRLLRVQIENDDALAVIKRYDSPDTLFYCDPPYPHESRGDKNAYKYEMTDFEHVNLANLLQKVKGKVAISGYRCEMYDELYKDWNIHIAPTKKALSIKSERTEILWTNY